MPCNWTGFQTIPAEQFGIISVDWSNQRMGPHGSGWANQRPMNCQKSLVEQAARIKAVSPTTHVWVYR